MGIKYEYKCPECDARLFSKERDAELYHYGYGDPGHNKTLMKRVYSLGGISFKGSGFYKNDKG